MNTTTWVMINNNYAININGEIKNLKTDEIKKNSINSKGYPYTRLFVDGKNRNLLIHRLIAIYFIPNPNGYPIVNHRDNNPTNHSISNLEWCSYSYNINYTLANKTGYKWLTSATVDMVKTDLIYGLKNVEIAKKYNLNIQQVSNIKTGRTYK